MPNQVAQKFQLNTRQDLWIRAQDATDLTALADLFAHGDPSRRLESVTTNTSHRLESAMAEATRAIALGPSDGSAWVVTTDLPDQPNAIVASGRYMWCNPDEASFSVVVRDDMQGQGIGSKLLYYVLNEARASGVKRMKANFASDNEAVWQILSYSPYHVTWQPQGKQVEVTIHMQAGPAPAMPSLN